MDYCHYLLEHLALMEWWMIPIVWNVTSTISQLRAFALCVPIWSNYLLSFLCKILVYRIFYMCGHLPFKSRTSNDKYHTGLKSHITICSRIHSKYKAWNYTLHIIQRQFCQYRFWWQFSQHLNLCHRFFGNKYEKIVSQSNVWREKNAFLYRALETNLCL